MSCRILKNAGYKNIPLSHGVLFFIVNTSARKEFYKHVSKVHDITGRTPPTIFNCFAHFWAFNNSIIDRLGA